MSFRVKLDFEPHADGTEGSRVIKKIGDSTRTVSKRGSGDCVVGRVGRNAEHVAALDLGPPTASLAFPGGPSAAWRARSAFVPEHAVA